MADLRESLFRYRSYTPIPFLLAMVLFARPSEVTMAAGALLAFLGETMRFWGVAYAGSLTRVTGSVGAPEVVVAGPYAYTRNPLYIGNIMMYCGVGIMANALSPWLVLVAFAYFTVQYWMIVSLEEEFLEKEFGDVYLQFKKDVPRFFPRIAPNRHPAQEHQKANWSEAFRSERRTFQAILIVMVLLLAIWYWR
ncbi:MAG TPA: isoprenylcysteine carboxylmethyltransferase family protein [Bacteroidetes bacterium]|nr:isoprenylcysteine carboxylmethyltransferase family protein [Bacteroidota bacterium]